MSMTSPRTATVRLTAPVAVIGTLAATLATAPAQAAERPAHTGQVHAPRLHALPTSAAVSRGAVHQSAVASRSYTIKPGDTVSSIAAKHGLATADLLSWNNLGWRSVIYPGQRLHLSPTSAKPNAAGPSASKPGAAKPGAAKPAPATAAASKTHTVVRGDTVYAIAQKYRTTVSAITSLNRLGGSAMIRPGQKLRISGTVTAAAAAPAAPASTSTAKPASATSHTVAAGETLSAIARKHDTTVAVLLRANGLGQGAIIYPGQRLRVSEPSSAPTSAQRSATLDATQKAHAARIIRIGRELGVPERGIAIALATAMVESSMRNLDHGDRDSLGLFQQRPSQGWGTRAQITDADRSIRVFYGGPSDPNGHATRGLLDIAGWQRMTFTDAAQTVQISAYPDRYGQWEHQAGRWLAALR